MGKPLAPGDEAVAHLHKAPTGRSCAIERYDHSWSFDFQGACRIHVESPWRIVTQNGIAFVDTDDGQKFGLPAPLDGQAKANELLAGLTVRRLAVAEDTADILIEFTGGTRIDLFNNSSGYEGWQATFGDVEIIGMGGGKLAIVTGAL